MKSLKISRKWKIAAMGAFVGGIGGYLYYHFIGCTSGNCAITSDPLNSAIYGMLLGGLAIDMIPLKKSDSEEAQKEG
jgi:hypothetical protein